MECNLDKQIPRKLLLWELFDCLAKMVPSFEIEERLREMMCNCQRLILGLLVLSMFFSQSVQSEIPLDVKSNAELKEAYELYQRAKMEDLKLTTDPNETGEQLRFSMLKKLVDQGRFVDIFNIGDEAFEKESDQRFGKGVGPISANGSEPGRLLTMVGGFDSGSCRSCHFKGGPDGSGTLTSIAMMRSDGVHANTATLRDSPHVMGLGYIQLIAGEMTADLKNIAEQAQSISRATGKAKTMLLKSKDIRFGEITAQADGSLDTSAVKHVRKDLIVRPFGHKGRAATLFSFVDEALQMHHGLQTDSRLESLKSKPKLIGAGPEWDPDQDGYQNEAAAGRTLLIASYLSMLPVPSIRPPSSSSLAIAWGNGLQLFSQVGCASCHVPELKFRKSLITHQIPRFPDVQVKIDLAIHGLSPAPVKVDHSPNTDDVIVPGVSIFPFTDLRLHDLGPAMADTNDEPTLDGDEVIGRSLWLTRSLWGLADTGPYLHDGRARTVAEAIDWHGGDAAAVRDRFNALEEQKQRSILVYLASLTREPTVLID